MTDTVTEQHPEVEGMAKSSDQVFDGIALKTQ